MVRQMYEAETPHQLDELVKENNISFIVVDRNNRISSEYQVNEDNIKEHMKVSMKRGMVNLSLQSTIRLKS